MKSTRQIHRLASSRMARIHPSIMRRIMIRTAALEAAGREIINLGIGRPDFDTPRPIKEAAIKAMEQGHVHYASTRGLIELRRAIAQDAETRLGLAVDPQNEVIVTAGSSNAIMTSLTAVLEPGDEIIAPEPLYLFYRDWGEPLGARTVGVPLDPDRGYQLTAQALRAGVSERTKVILINSPHNPTGAGLNRAGLEAVARVAREKDLVVITDEVYDKIVYPPFKHQSLAALPGMKERTILINSFSKPYAMDGWRLGYLIAPAGLVEEIDNCHHRNLMCAATFAQYGAMEALRLSPEIIQPMLEEYRIRRDLALDLLSRSDQVETFTPQGAFYLWLRLTRPGADDLAVTEELLDRTGVAVTPGSTFGPKGRGYLRLSFAVPRDKLERGINLILENLASAAETARPDQ